MAGVAKRKPTVEMVIVQWLLLEICLAEILHNGDSYAMAIALTVVGSPIRLYRFSRELHPLIKHGVAAYFGDLSKALTSDGLAALMTYMAITVAIHRLLQWPPFVEMLGGVAVVSYWLRFFALIIFVLSLPWSVAVAWSQRK